MSRPSELRLPFSLTTRRGNAISSGVKRFVAFFLILLSVSAFAATEKPLATIALLSDPHTMLRTNDQPGVYERHFAQAIAQVNESNVDFVLITGDLANGGKADQLHEFLNRIKKFQAPVYFVPGNHDVGNKLNAGKGDGHVTADRVKSYERIMGQSFFATNQHGVRIIGLNSSLLGSGLEGEREQWKFLESEFTNKEKPKIVFMHYPLYLTNATERGGGYWNVEPKPRKRFLEMSKDANVKAVLTGHLHRAITNNYEGALLYSAPPISFPLGKKTTVAWTLVKLWKDREPTIEMKSLDP
jgi:3',5'-cyclic AMP phosphodiesterase CpdA